MVERVTITDVAQWANVSITTVSHYLNGTKKVSADVSRRIQAAITELNYVPNANARSLKGQRTRVVGIIIPDMVIYSSICQYIEEFLYEQGYSVIICSTNFDHAKENIQLRSLMEQRVDGLIVASSGQNNRFIQSISDSGTPVVLFDRYQPGLPDMNYVLEKSAECISKITEFVLDRGHRHIAYMKGPDNSTVSVERFKVFGDILRERGLEPLPEFCYGNLVTKEDSCRAITHLLDHRDQVTAVITTNANQIKYFMMAVHERGIRVPEELSVTGFGIEDYKTLFSFPMTCIIQNSYEIARSCATRILELMNPKTKEPVLKPKTILLDSEFFVGKSVRDILG